MIQIGYDMYVVDDAGNNVSGLTLPECGHETHYWRRNLSGGVRQAEEFIKAGMGAWGPDDVWLEADKKGFPALPAGVTRDDEADGYVGEGAAEYTAALHAYLRDPRGVTHGIPVYKLTNTNDGWWVTKEECEHALLLWEAAGQPVVDDFGYGAYGDTIPFLRAAADHGGFRVY